MGVAASDGRDEMTFSQKKQNAVDAIAILSTCRLATKSSDGVFKLAQATRYIYYALRAEVGQ